VGLLLCGVDPVEHRGKSSHVAALVNRLHDVGGDGLRISLEGLSNRDQRVARTCSAPGRSPDRV
jgi:hypothetical protein